MNEPRPDLLRSLFDHLAAGVYFKDLDGHYVLVNRQFEHFCGQAAGSVTGKTDCEILPREAADVLGQDDEAVRARCDVVQRTLCVPHPDGPRDFLSTKSPVVDATSAVWAIVGTLTEIIHRRWCIRNRPHSHSHNLRHGKPYEQRCSTPLPPIVSRSIALRDHRRSLTNDQAN